ncbi:purine-cytosine permease family protein [Gordonia sp. NPDC003424]
MSQHDGVDVSIDPTGKTHPGGHIRVGRLSLTMAFWALTSAMFWLYIAVASNAAVGTVNTLIGMVLSIATYGALSTVLSRHAIRTGHTISFFSGRIFGSAGAGLATLLLAATAIYYAVFEGSIIAVALQQYFGGTIKLWYLAVALYILPLVIGGVQNWMDRLNGFLLPLYVVGLVALVAAATVKQGYPTDWLAHSVPSATLPGWVSSYLIYMGVWVMMMYVFEFARLGKVRDAKFLSNTTFGWPFFAITIGINGLVGIYLVSAWGLGEATETGVVSAVIKSLGFVGVLLVIISQTRINSANYYVASMNIQDLATTVLRRPTPRLIWVLVTGAIIYLLMLTNVLSYLLTALAWQGVFICSWVTIAVLYVLLSARRDLAAAGGAGSKVQARGLAILAWAISSGVGILLTEQSWSPTVAALAPAITVALAAALYIPSQLMSAKSTSDDVREAAQPA